MLASAIARETRRLRLLIAIQPWFIHPAYATQMAASLQRLSGGRVEWNVISGGGGAEQRAYGDFIAHDERYQRTSEFLDFVKGYAAGEPFSYQGNYYQVEEGGLKYPMNQYPTPRIWLAGASDAAMQVAAKHADIHLTWGEPLENQRIVVEKAKEAIERQGLGRQVNFGMRIDILARETEAQAWAELRQMYATVPENSQAFGRRDTESVGAQRQNSLRRGQHFDDLIVGKNLWAGMSAIRGGPGCVIVGSHEQVGERLAEYVDIGVNHFILASNPHLEEAYRVAEEVLPLVGQAIKGNQKIKAIGEVKVTAESV